VLAFVDLLHQMGCRARSLPNGFVTSWNFLQSLTLRMTNKRYQARAALLIDDLYVEKP
jgi:hypothetical protein